MSWGGWGEEPVRTGMGWQSQRVSSIKGKKEGTGYSVGRNQPGLLRGTSLA